MAEKRRWAILNWNYHNLSVDFLRSEFCTWKKSYTFLFCLIDNDFGHWIRSSVCICVFKNKIVAAEQFKKNWTKNLPFIVQIKENYIDFKVDLDLEYIKNIKTFSTTKFKASTSKIISFRHSKTSKFPPKKTSKPSSLTDRRYCATN